MNRNYYPQADNSTPPVSPSVPVANGDNRLNPNLVLIAIVALGIVGILAIIYMSSNSKKKCECKGGE